MNVVALVVASVMALAPATPAGPHQWSVEMLDGSPAATATLFTDVVVSPGRSFSSGYLIPHSADITGPLDITAEALSPSDELESTLDFGFGIDGAPGPTTSLSDLLNGQVLRVTDALPAGIPRLDITVSMDSAPTTQAKLQQVVFRFLLTLSDQTIVIPVTPPSALAATGVDPPIRALVLVAAAIAGGVLALLLSRRRRARREASPAARPGSPAPPSR
jgi:hypothetical protein